MSDGNVDKEKEDFKLYVGETIIGKHIKYNGIHYDVTQDEDGFIYITLDVDYTVYKHKVIYFYETGLLEVGFPEVLVFKQKNKKKIENYGIPKGTYNLVQEELLENNEILTELVVDDGVEFGENKYIFSQAEDGKIYISTNETMNDKKQIIYFYEEKLLQVRWNENIILQFKQEEIKDEINKE